jgi:predicted 2-oxoglutarate/Fe(II)-dependent dioxygenase YbiX
MRVYSLGGFLEPEECRRVQIAMDRGVPEPAEVLYEQTEIEPDVRRASSFDVDAETLDLVEGRLDSLRSTLGDFYATRLGPREGANFLRYEDGGFYRRHRDRAEVASWPGAAWRRLAIIVFLNSGRDAETSGSFAGGTLRLFPEDEAQAIDIPPVAGTLVAFPATVSHEVTVVRDGTRDTIVDWFY